MFLREPHDRAVSAWKQKCVETQHGKLILKGLKLPCSFQDFVRYLIEKPIAEMDDHIQPQWFQLQDIHVSIEAYRLSNIDRVWHGLRERFGWLELNRFNTSSHDHWRCYFRKIPKKSWDAFDQKFGKDVYLYERIPIH